MQSTHISIIILLLAALYYPAPSLGDRSELVFKTGQRLPHDQIFMNTTDLFEIPRNGYSTPLNFVKTYSDTLDRNYVITSVEITRRISDKGNNGQVFVGIVAGGPGKTFVSIAYCAESGLRYFFDIKLYGTNYS